MQKVTSSKSAVFSALLAALLFSLSAPFAKLLLGGISPMFMASLLYLGAAAGMLAVRLASGTRRKEGAEAGISRADLRWVLLMILLDIAAPFLLMAGLSLTTASNASLLANFEIVATSFFALVFFKEAVGLRMWISIGIITVASIVLSIDFGSSGAFTISVGSLLVLCACLFWGLENNCTRNLSAKDPMQIVVIKGFGSGSVALIIALMTEKLPDASWNIAGALALGFVSYGLSIFFYILAQRRLGAARTSVYYAIAPFFGALLSFLILGEKLGIWFGIGLVLMLAGTAFAVSERHAHSHAHMPLTHEHSHSHLDPHHDHPHDGEVSRENVHSHMHTHAALVHNHEHLPDIHHRHAH